MSAFNAIRHRIYLLIGLMLMASMQWTLAETRIALAGTGQASCHMATMGMEGERAVVDGVQAGDDCCAHHPNLDCQIHCGAGMFAFAVAPDGLFRFSSVSTRFVEPALPLRRVSVSGHYRPPRHNPV